MGTERSEARVSPRPASLAATMASGVLLAVAAASCRPPEPVTEVGRWTDDRVAAVYIVYHLAADLPEQDLLQRLKPVAREQAAGCEFVIQVAVHDREWAHELAGPEGRRRVRSSELLVGSPMIDDESMTVRGGMVYTYYRSGDYDEVIFLGRDPG